MSQEASSDARNRKKINLFIFPLYTYELRGKEMLGGLLCDYCDPVNLEELALPAAIFSSSQLGSTRIVPPGKIMVGTLLYPLFIAITKSVASWLFSSPTLRYSIRSASKNALARRHSGQDSVVYMTICDGVLLHRSLKGIS